MEKVTRNYGWKKRTPDERDIMLTAFNEVKANNPPMMDLRPQCPPVYDQGNLGSCTANSSAGLAEFLLKKTGKPDFMPSRLFIYYNERVLEDTVSEDSGASLTDAIKVLARLGAPHEHLWWYDIAKFKVKPNKDVYTDGLKHRLGAHHALDNTNIDQLKTCLANGYPFIFGFTVYASMESDAVAKSGVLPMPQKDEAELGGHAVMGVGYDDSRSAFIIRNSWGAGWGLGGYFYMPYQYITNLDLASDFWTAQTIA